MASTWGTSWDAAWGDSWGAVAAADPVLSSGRVASSTSWNKEWAEKYGPDVDKARDATRQEVRAAISAFDDADYVPQKFEAAQDIVESKPPRALMLDLMHDDESRVIMMTAYYEFLRWQQQDEDDVIAILLLT